MCYSVRVERSLDRIAQHFDAAIDWNAFLDVFTLRECGADLKIPPELDQYFLDAPPIDTMAIRTSIHGFRRAKQQQVKEELRDLQLQIEHLHVSIAVNPTKTREKQLATHLRKREKLENSIRFTTAADTSYRVFPFYFAPVLMQEQGRRVIVPMRYRLRPQTGELPAAYQVYNARRDALCSARNWKRLYGRRHCVFPFMNFYEWVDRERGGAQELQFHPDNADNGMWAAGLFDEYETDAGLIRSFAIITDEAPPDVAQTGHLRCPLFLRRDLIDDWLNPTGQSIEQLDALLNEKESERYIHAPVR